MVIKLDIQCKVQTANFNAGEAQFCNEIFDEWYNYVQHMVDEHKLAEYVGHK